MSGTLTLAGLRYGFTAKTGTTSLLKSASGHILDIGQFSVWGPAWQIAAPQQRHIVHGTCSYYSGGDAYFGPAVTEGITFVCSLGIDSGVSRQVHLEVDSYPASPEVVASKPVVGGQLFELRW